MKEIKVKGLKYVDGKIVEYEYVDYKLSAINEQLEELNINYIDGRYENFGVEYKGKKYNISTSHSNKTYKQLWNVKDVEAKKMIMTRGEFRTAVKAILSNR